MATSPEQLTSEELSLLSKHLWFYSELAEGKRRPTTPAQTHFVDVCNGKLPAETDHEKVFLKYRRQKDAADQAFRQMRDNFMDSDTDRWW